LLHIEVGNGATKRHKKHKGQVQVDS
jgi:hypothetical protein